MTIAHRLVALLTLLICASLGLSCEKSKKEEKPPADGRSASVDAHADKTLEKELKNWKRRWAREKTPPGCEEVLNEASQVEDCARTAKLLVSVQQAANKMEGTPATLKHTADLALAAANAEQSLRKAAMEGLASRGSPGAKGGDVGPTVNVPKTTPGRASAAARVRGTDVGAGANMPPRRTPYAPVLRAYSNLARQALRYLGVFLERGPKAVRTAALAEVERLAPKRDRWRALAQTVRQASRVENDPGLQERLSALEKKLSPRTLPPPSRQDQPSTWPRPAPSVR